MAGTIEFYWDFPSPFAYIGAMHIEGVAAKYGMSVDWRPVSLGHLWKAIPDRQPMHKAKMDYMAHDWTRSAELAGLRIVTYPSPFPTDAKLPRLMFYRLKAQDPVRAVSFAKAAFAQYWGQGQDIAKPEHLAPLLDALNIPQSELEAAAGDAAARQAVLDMTGHAVGINAFGTPTFVIDGEMFWGADRLHHIDLWLERRANG